jgi:hypothetical protein
VAIYHVRYGQVAEQWVVADDELQTAGTPTLATPAP